MKQNTNDTKRLEALHHLYYTLAHHVLPDIILSENAEKLLLPNPAGEGLLSEAGTAAIPSGTRQDSSETAQGIADHELHPHMAEQEEKHLEMGLFNFEDDLPPFGKTIDPADDNGYTLDDEVADDFFGVDSADDDFDTDAAYNNYDAVDENFFDSEEDENVANDQADDLIAELESMLELHTLGQAYDNPDEAFLADTWREAWFQTELEDYPANTGYTLRRINQQGYEIIQFSFPKPFHMTDAWQAIAIRQKGMPYRYFTLENTVSDGKEKGVLAERDATGKHTNYGITTYDVTDTAVFLDMVLENL